MRYSKKKEYDPCTPLPYEYDTFCLIFLKRVLYLYYFFSGQHKKFLNVMIIDPISLSDHFCSSLMRVDLTVLNKASFFKLVLTITLQYFKAYFFSFKSHLTLNVQDADPIRSFITFTYRQNRVVSCTKWVIKNEKFVDKPESYDVINNFRNI